MEPVKINVSVRELVSYSIPGEEHFFSFVSAKEGIEGHMFIHGLLKQRTEPFGIYRQEIPVSTTFAHDIFLLQISGRLDGLIERNGNFTLCEIKTTDKPLDTLDESDNPAHWAQGRCYAYIVAKEKGLDKIGVMLLYLHRQSREIRVFEETLTFGELERFFNSLVFPFIYGLKKRYDWQHLRNVSIKELTFPFPDFRKGQRIMSGAVYRAIRDGKKQFIQAPTGIGKTIGALFPAIKAMGEGHVDKIFYLTARNTTQAEALKAYKMLAEKGLRIKTLQITAKEKVCFMPGKQCVEEECPYIFEYMQRSRSVVSNAVSRTDLFSREFIELTAKENGLCPFELSLDLSTQADLIICDYNYVFDPRVYLRRFFQDKTDENICLLIDEAHNLPERAREMFSAELKRSMVRIVYHKLKNTLPYLANSLKKVRKALLSYAAKVSPVSGKKPYPQVTSDSEPPKELTAPIDNFIYLAEGVLNDETPYPFKEELAALFFEMVHFSRIFDLYGENYATIYSREKGDFSVKLFCVDPAPMLKKRTENSKSSIFFSATLSPPSYFREILGGNEGDGFIILPSPFPRENLYLYVDNTVSTRFRHRAGALSSIVERIHECVSVKTGNYMVFFPSFEYMQKAAAEYMNRFPGDRILIQEQDMDENRRAEFLASFSEYGKETLIAFVVMGGIFSEGIDLKGECLSGVIIVGVGLPQVCEERDIIKKYYQKKNGKGFEFAYTYPGLNKVQQAAGRVIRSEHDRGFVVLIDDRFTTPLYLKIMPREWFPLKTSDNGTDLIGELKKFWKCMA
ncbi:ATP-dependent DNA helicase [Thermoclostridium stercorarium subsp. leptospartum DSM 9219]|uniref:ATP-dependent DNA helicase n=1 Tax=Thermoclostridium stercorarium subsp. leptospartum DSM 9219 TaxID=1346611 RepID=A0A1B1YJR3_THEST|nr:ATP-dependent DNA helicase [Thermoclostridium stercorarium]ANX00984.1 ATP-dependent DNA helicase [Thermoclostridium stercorarium subsp. leptospartum DSM 9219]